MTAIPKIKTLTPFETRIVIACMSLLFVDLSCRHHTKECQIADRFGDELLAPCGEPHLGWGKMRSILRIA
jgi:hypothetical protein